MDALDTQLHTPQPAGSEGQGGAEPAPRRGKGGRLSPRRALALSAVLLALALAGVGIYRLFFAQEEKLAITGSTTFGALNEAIEGSGTTTPADSVTYEINGTVLEWYVEAGDEVEEGQLLYVLDSSDVKDEILENEVELEELYEQLDDLLENIANQNVTADFSGRVQAIQAEEGKNVQNGTLLATLIDDSFMTATLYFSYAYQEQLREGMTVTASFPEQMLTLSGTVSGIHYVDYVTAEGMKCFAVDILVENPGSLTEGTAVTCWAVGSDGSELYAANDAKLEYRHAQSITAGASGELTEVRVVDYQRVQAGQTLFVIDASGYETQLETLQKQIDNYEEKIADLEEAIATEYSRRADIAGQVVTAAYATNRMTGNDMGTVVIYNQTSMQISVNIDELDADYLEEGMEVYVYRTTSSQTLSYPATLTYLSLEASSSGSGVSTFAAEITIDSQGTLSSGVTVYYSIDTSGGESREESVLAPLNALCSYDEGYYLLVQSEKKPDGAIDPALAGGSVTDYPDGFYAVPVEVGDYNESSIQILSGVEEGAVLFLRYRNAQPSGGESTSNVVGSDGGAGGMPDFGGNLPDFGGGMPNMGGMSGGGMGAGMGGGMPNMGGGRG